MIPAHRLCSQTFMSLLGLTYVSFFPVVFYGNGSGKLELTVLCLDDPFPNVSLASFVNFLKCHLNVVYKHLY